LKPTVVMPAFKQYDLYDLDIRFSTKLILFYLVMIVVMVIFGFGFFFLFQYINLWFTHRDPAAIYLGPSLAIWWFFPIFGALSMSWEITLRLWMLFNKQDALLLDYYNSLKSGFDCRRVLNWLTIGISLPILLATTLALPMHASISKSEILDYGYAHLQPSTYKLKDASHITYVEGILLRNGTFQANPHFVIDFSNGNRWSSMGWDLDSNEIPSLIDFFLANTGDEVNPVRTDEAIQK
jgi:hypothetical protein